MLHSQGFPKWSRDSLNALRSSPADTSFSIIASKSSSWSEVWFPFISVQRTSSKIRFRSNFNKWGVSSCILIFSWGLTGWGIYLFPSRIFNSLMMPIFPMSMVIFLTIAPAESHFRINSFRSSKCQHICFQDNKILQENTLFLAAAINQDTKINNFLFWNQK